MMPSSMGQSEQKPRRTTRIAKPSIRLMSPFKPLKSRLVGTPTSTKPVAKRQKRRSLPKSAQLSKARKVVQKPKTQKAQRGQRRKKLSA